MKYICSKCGIEENIGHVNPVVEPYLCESCWKIQNVIQKSIVIKDKIKDVTII